MFTHTSQPVCSVVVVPLLVGDNAFGALYFTQEVACDFSNIQETLLVRRGHAGDAGRRATRARGALTAQLEQHPGNAAGGWRNDNTPATAPGLGARVACPPTWCMHIRLHA